MESGQWRKRGVKGCEKLWERGVRWRGGGGNVGRVRVRGRSGG